MKTKRIKFNKDKIDNFAKTIRSSVIKTAYNTGGKNAHIGGALSMCDILVVLFTGIINLNIYNFKKPDRDKFILSKGHSTLSYYAVLKELGFITNNELSNYEKKDSFLFGHPVRNLEKGIEFSTGSLGMGISLGVGSALASKVLHKKNKIFVIVGDGECNEGSVWEAAMCATKYKLNNLTIIVDKNNFQQTGSTEEIMPNEGLSNRWREFGWNTKEVNGHDYLEIYNALTHLNIDNKPIAIIANTVKGKGVSVFENNNKWHHNIVTKYDYELAIKELEQN